MEEKWRNLREIEAQRSDVIDKLEKIEEKKATVSVEVYTKVKKEYEDKLNKIEGKLTDYIDLIKEEITHLKQEEKQLVKQQKEISLKIEEIELRYSIGEYDEDSFKEIDEKNKEGLKAISTKLEKLQGRVKWFKDFVEIKDLEKDLEIKEEVKSEKELEIDEHILEEKTPEDIQLDELLVPEEAVKPEVTSKKESVSEEQPTESKEEEEKGVPCPKCGFMNTQDSWYCEKCGAEILNSPN